MIEGQEFIELIRLYVEGKPTKVVLVQAVWVYFSFV
jgi:hypothetical protein